MKLEKNFAHFISILFNPFLVLTSAVVLGNIPWLQNSIGSLIFVIAILIFLPLIAYTYKISTKRSSFWTPHNLLREDRNGVYLFGIYISLFATVIFSYMQINYWMANSIIAFLLISALFVTNKFFDKASVHTAMFCFAVFYLTDKLSTSFGLFLVALPIIMWARVTLHQHTWLQLFLGIVIGISIGLLSWTI